MWHFASVSQCLNVLLSAVQLWSQLHLPSGSVIPKPGFCATKKSQIIAHRDEILLQSCASPDDAIKLA